MYLLSVVADSNTIWNCVLASALADFAFTVAVKLNLKVNKAFAVQSHCSGCSVGLSFTGSTEIALSENNEVIHPL